jgi:hypothetical protein
VLLQKTWESLQQSCEPKISISGTCVDLYRLGYKGQPIRLHDMVIVEIEETGELLYRQVICNDVDLVDPTGTRPEIGDYIPNIVYINRDTNTKASGGGGGGGRGSMTNLEDEDLKWYTEFIKTQNQIGMVIRRKNGTDYIDAAAIALAINESNGETTALIKADHVNISATQTVHTLAGSVEVDANGKLVITNAGGMYVRRTEQGITAEFGIWDRGNLTGGVMVQEINGQTAVKISGDVIDINGSSIVINADRIDVNGIVSALASLSIQVQSLTVDGEATMDSIDASSIDVSGTVIGGDATFDSVTVPDGELTLGAYSAMWKMQSVVTSVTQVHYGAQYFALTSDGKSVSGSAYINPVTNVSSTSTTLYYLGL